MANKLVVQRKIKVVTEQHNMYVSSPPATLLLAQLHVTLSQLLPRPLLPSSAPLAPECSF